MKTYLYKITNKRNGSAYVGIARNIIKRWKKHCRVANKSRPQMAIAAAIKKYGKDAFIVEELACYATKAEAGAAEVRLIAKLQCSTRLYNRSIGGDGLTGFRLSDAAKKKLSENWKVGYKQRCQKISEATRVAMSNPEIKQRLLRGSRRAGGWRHSEETKEKMRRAALLRYK